MDYAFVVESPCVDGATGERVGTYRLFTATEARAREVASVAPDRTWRKVHMSQIPAHARENLLKNGKA